MNKIRYELYNQIIDDKRLTSDEISMLFYVARNADDRGYLDALYYKYASKDIDISISGFYGIISNLKKYGYISSYKSCAYDMDVSIANNSFYDENTDKMVYTNYININVLAFDSRFYKLKANSKRLLMELYKRGINQKIKKEEKAENRRYAKIFYLPNNEYIIYAHKLDVSVRMIKKYFKEIKDYVCVGHKIYDDHKDKPVDIVTIKETALENCEVIYYDNKKVVKRKKPLRFDSDRHFIRSYCRRNKIEYENETLDNVAMLVTQYERRAVTKNISIRKLLLDSLDALNEIVLHPPAINKIISNILNTYNRIEA